MEAYLKFGGAKLTSILRSNQMRGEINNRMIKCRGRFELEQSAAATSKIIQQKSMGQQVNKSSFMPDASKEKNVPPVFVIGHSHERLLWTRPPPPDDFWRPVAGRDLKISTNEASIPSDRRSNGPKLSFFAPRTVHGYERMNRTFDADWTFAKGTGVYAYVHTQTSTRQD
jgi:hypothetical protein